MLILYLPKSFINMSHILQQLKKNYLVANFLYQYVDIAKIFTFLLINVGDTIKILIAQFHKRATVKF